MDDEDLENIIGALRDAGLSIPDEVQDARQLEIAIRSNGRLVRASDDDDSDPDDSEMDDDEDEDGDADKGEKDFVHPPYQLGHDRVPVAPQTDAAFQRKWDRALGRRPKKTKDSSK